MQADPNSIRVGEHLSLIEPAFAFHPHFPRAPATHRARPTQTITRPAPLLASDDWLFDPEWSIEATYAVRRHAVVAPVQPRPHRLYRTQLSPIAAGPALLESVSSADKRRLQNTAHSYRKQIIGSTFAARRAGR
jgi:hypothetical protein